MAQPEHDLGRIEPIRILLRPMNLSTLALIIYVPTVMRSNEGRTIYGSVPYLSQAENALIGLGPLESSDGLVSERFAFNTNALGNFPLYAEVVAVDGGEVPVAAQFFDPSGELIALSPPPPRLNLGTPNALGAFSKTGIESFVLSTRQEPPIPRARGWQAHRSPKGESGTIAVIVLWIIAILRTLRSRRPGGS